MNAEPETNGPAGPPAAPGWPANNSPSHPIPTGGKLLRGSNAWMLNGLGGQPILYSSGHVIHSKIGSYLQTKLAVITGGGTTGPLRNLPQGPQFVDWTNANPDYKVAVRDPEHFDREKQAVTKELAIKTAADISLRVLCTAMEKLADCPDYDRLIDQAAKRRTIAKGELIHQTEPLVTQVLLGAPVQDIIKESAHEPAPADHPSAPAEQLRPRVEVMVYNDDGVRAINKGDYVLLPGGGIDDGEEPRDALIRETHEELGHNLANIEPGPVVESIWPDNFPGATPGFKGERTHFFLALENGPAGMVHDDQEEFLTTHPEDVRLWLERLIAADKQGWSVANNTARLQLLAKADRQRHSHAMKRAAAPIPGIIPGIAPDPNRAFIAQLAAPLKQKAAQGPAAPAAAQSGASLPPEVFHPTPSTAAAKTADEHLRRMCLHLEKFGQLLPGDDSGIDISGGELTPGPVDFNQNVQADVHGQPQAAKLVQFAQQDPSMKAVNAQQGATVDDQLQGQQMKTADEARLLPRKQFLLFTPDGRVVVRRLGDRRFTLPEKGEGRPAPYEHPVRLVPERGVPEAGYHGYELGLNVGQTAAVPQGFEALPPQDVLKDLYAGMGLAKNKPFMQVDRSRSRAILRYLKSTAPAATPSPMTAAAVAAPEP